MKRRRLAVALLFAPVWVTAAASEIEYRMTRCTSTGEGRFSIAFEGPRKEQRRIALVSAHLGFGGHVKGEVAVGDVRELRLSPVLEVVFNRSEHQPLRFGPLSPECRKLVKNAAGRSVRVRDGED